MAILLVAGVAGTSVAQQRATNLAAPLDGLAFLIGDWSAGRGQVADTGGLSTGRSRVTVEVGGHALLRRDHTDLFDVAGKPMGGFDQIMLIYPEAGEIHADYSDGSHVVHYASATVEPGRAVTFVSAPQPRAPTFRLRYRLTAPATLSIDFAMSPPGSGAFRSIAAGTLTRPGS